MSAELATTLVAHVARLLPGLVSLTADDVIETVLVSVDPTVAVVTAVTVSVMVAVLLASSVPRLHVTVPPEFVHVSPTADLNVVWGGIVSLTTTLGASLGPALVAVIV